MSDERQRYKVLKGLNYPPNGQRAGVGSVVDDLVPSQIPVLLELEAIEPSSEPLKRIDDTGPMAIAPSNDEAPAPAPADEED